MSYKIKSETTTVTLDAPYHEGDSKVEVTGLKSVKWKVLSEIATLSQKSDEEKAAGYLPKIEGWLHGWLRNWNITYGDDTPDKAGQPFPLSEMGELPSDLVIAIFNAMSKALGGANQLPPASEQPSSPTS